MRRLTGTARVKELLAVASMVWLAGFLPTGHCFGQPVSGKQIPDASWVSTGSLNTVRSGHTATLLPNGRVLVAGGGASSGRLNSAELYDPATGAWTPTGSLGLPRSGHTATLLANGNVLVVGSSDWSDQGTAELYDPASGTWTRTGSLQTPRSWHTATLLPSGKVLVVGGVAPLSPGPRFGWDPALASAELYDPATGVWQYTGNLAKGRGFHSATRLRDGRVLAAAGQSNNDPTDYFPMSSAEVYDPVAGVWSDTGDIGAPREQVAATLLQSGKVLVAGGCCTEQAFLFDPAAGWSMAAAMSVSRVAHTATLLLGGQVLVAGGTDWRCCLALKSAEIYDPSTGGWRAIASMSEARIGHTATMLADGKVLVAGGGVASAELYVAGVSPSGTIGAGFTGAWYDPAQSGHGLLIEVLPEQRLYATWFAFNPGGTQQAWFTGVGTYSGNTATITSVQQPAGGRWIPNFDPGQIVRNEWGTLTFMFTDCDHGRVDFNSVAGYGSGSMSLVRLTQPMGLSCP